MTEEVYIACICEGAAEEAIIDILLDNDKLIFSRKDMIEEDPIRCRGAKNFEREYLNNKDTIVLYLFSYLKIEKLISDVLESYVNVFNVNMKRYLKYLREKKENQGENA